MTTPTTRTTGCVWFAPESETAPCYDLRQLEAAYRACRKGKRAKVRTCLYENQLLDNLWNTSQALQARRWRPKPPVAFVVTKPKCREVYAAQFADRVVHHLLVSYLEPLLEKELIFDAASNRKYKGTHFAAQRLRHFMRKTKADAARGKATGLTQSSHLQGWFLQLDIANFFNSVRHDILLALLQRKLNKWRRKKRISEPLAEALLWLSKVIITQRITTASIRLSPAQDFARVPAHKRLQSAPPGQGLPIGNLTSQFFANLYMNELDQFVKHQLKCRCYVRYVDDFVLCHTNPQQLREWQRQIADFIGQTLALRLKARPVLAPVDNGADFLGYIIRPDYTLVRKRVLGNLHEKLSLFARRLLREKSQGLLLQCGHQVVARLPFALKKQQPFAHPRLQGLLQFPISQLNHVRMQLQQRALAYVFCSEQGWLTHRLKKRAVRLIFTSLPRGSVGTRELILNLNTNFAQRSKP